MTIHLDTSALVGALAGPGAAADRLYTFIDQGHRLRLSSIVLYEWLRGPRTVSELRVQEALFPREQAVPFDTEAAAEAAGLYARLSRPRGRDLDLAIAASALVNEATLWTLNPKDFSDVPGLRLA
ncbi:MAG: type II toxin-antitoxin system VapC family toxin [Acidobacteria bacterium]|nr:type II toxin-antitoxin system VapC family toxin [Acidobacteriota bacterium]MXZ71524.1 type II toxin-antitoxin system VapC family toxin [Acidobacteriota bacterium]MYD72402.1 type II toxin-antitoxin system VapC family toxin [Acidobacteriota bacterium]MYJ04466.1 type II toxin-antitoxin system VapC family toxin [Acidobacteriota bacterium]